MKLTIQDRDYSCWLDASKPLAIERKLNEPSVCEFGLSLPTDGSVAQPVRRQPLAVSGDDGTLYFTGYIATAPLPRYAGMGIAGARYRLAIQALSDEFLLDQFALSPAKGGTGMAAGSMMMNLTKSIGSSALSEDGLSLDVTVSQFTSEHGWSWSQAAGQIANEARGTYRALGGSLTLAQIPAVIHALSDIDGSLNPESLTLQQGTARMLANDLTVCGGLEPTTYVEEYFEGDGVTTQFELGVSPYVGSSAGEGIIYEQFDENEIDQRKWSVSGGPNYMSLAAGGLAINGGSGLDGDSTLCWRSPIEMGGSLLLESSGVSLFAGSLGIVTGLFTELDTQAGCIAGFQVSPAAGSGAVCVQPIIMGTPGGQSYAIDSSRNYTLRIRLNCAEIERELSVYRSYGDAGSVNYGGQSIDGRAQIRMEIQESVNGAAGVPVTLYDGGIMSLPGACSVVAASSQSLLGSMRSIALTRGGSGWVVSTPTGGGPYSRRMGSLAQGGECHLDRSGKLVFENGYAPLTGERVAVSYRATGRAVGRVVSIASQTELAQAGLSNVATWIGSVKTPQARSSADCRNAATALMQASTSANGLWSGTYQGVRGNFDSDVWPGDALSLQVQAINFDAQMVIRSVKLSYQGTYPELISYSISFANEWADDLAIRTSKAIPEDAWLPAPVSLTVLPNLTGLAVTSVTGATVSINTGVAAPVGGGFEIRRRDFGFGPGEDADLVMRGTQQNLAFNRVSANDHYYVRMFDGSTPPNYSEFSAALFINLPLGS